LQLLEYHSKYYDLFLNHLNKEITTDIHYNFFLCSLLMLYPFIIKIDYLFLITHNHLTKIAIFFTKIKFKSIFLNILIKI